MDRPDFIPRSYTDVSNLAESKRMWVALNRDNLKIRMMTASDLGRPALEGVADELLDEFGDQFKEDYKYRDRFKQMTGAMVRQVMESIGYAWVRDNIPLSGAPFSRASKYRRRDAVDFHLWRHSTNPRLVGVTLEKSGEKLPSQPEGEWKYWKLVEGSLQEKKLHLCIAAGIREVTAALNALKEKGVYTELTQRLLSAR